jgi:hypothetical protein
VAFAGLMLLRGLVLLALLLFFALSARARHGIPPGAVQHLPALRAQLAQAWPDMPSPPTWAPSSSMKAASPSPAPAAGSPAPAC